jgi:hypothetical protein
MGSARILGKQLGLEIDGDDYWADVISCVKKVEENGDTVTTFEDAQAGTTLKHYFEINMIQSTAADSFWTFCTEHVGEIVPFQYAVHGNAAPATGQPHLLGNVEIGNPPDLGGEAGRKNTYTATVRFDIIGEPTYDSTP